MNNRFTYEFDCKFNWRNLSFSYRNTTIQYVALVNFEKWIGANSKRIEFISIKNLPILI